MTPEINMLYQECTKYVECVGCPVHESPVRIGESIMYCSSTKTTGENSKENEESVDKQEET